jgi:hypothetical protein
MMMPTTTTTQQTTSTSSARKPAKSTGKRGVAKKKYQPTKHPKPSLAELALLVGPARRKPILPAKLPLLEVKWHEHAVPCQLLSTDQAFIGSQVARLQSIILKTPALPSAVKSQNPKTLPQPIPLPSPQQPQLKQPASSASTVVTSVKGSNNKLTPEELAWLENASTSELSALLGLVSGESIQPEQPEVVLEFASEEESYSESIELYLPTPVESKLADFLGIDYQPNVTISVSDKPMFSGAAKVGTAQPAPPPVEAVSDLYFTETLEQELAQQKAWLESALAREKQKPYPPVKVNTKPAELKAKVLASIASAEAQQDPFTLVAKPATTTVNLVVEPESVTPLTAESSSLAPSDALTTTVTPPLLDEATETSLPPESEEATATNNEENFAAVLDCLFEDFSTEADAPEIAPSATASVDLPNFTAEQAQLVPPVAELFDIVGLKPNPQALEDDSHAQATDAMEKLPTDEPVTDTQAPVAIEEALNSFPEWLQLSAPQTAVDYLLLGALFLKQQEEQAAFTLRQLNQLLTSVSKPNANHSVLEMALSSHYIVLLPDLTGMATATQYQLSEKGEAQALAFFEVPQLV